MRVAVLISGRGSNLGALLQAEAEGHLAPARIVGVASDRPQAKGLDLAREAGVPVQVLPEDWAHGLLSFLDERRPDLLCLAGFMRILPPEAIRRMEGRILNIHPSLLPAFPGLRVHERVLEARMPVSGCSVHWVDEGVDTGQVVGQRMVGVLEEDSPESLAVRVLAEEHGLYPEMVAAVARGKISPPERAG